MAYKKSYSYNGNNRIDVNHRKRIDVFLKSATAENGTTYMRGYHPLVGKVTVFEFPEGDKGYVGKVGLTANNLKK